MIGRKEPIGLIGGPMGGEQVVIHGALQILDVWKPGERLSLAITNLPDPRSARPVRGRYVRLAHTSPAVYLWQGWEK